MSFKQITEHLYTLDGHVKFMGSLISTRMTVIRVADNRLLIYSPLEIDEASASKLSQLGEVTWIIAPNRYHHLHVNACAARYQSAQVWLAPGLAERIPDLPPHQTLTDETYPDWRDEISHLCFSAMPIFNEIVLCHHPSQALIITDIAFNLQNTDWTPFGLYLRYFSGVFKQVGLSRLLKREIKDRTAARQQIDQILNWDFKRIVMAHGEVVETNGKQLLQRAYAWL